MNFETKKERDIVLDEENEMKCYPQRSNSQMPYQKIEKEIRLNKQWPPITDVNELTNGINRIVTPVDINNNSGTEGGKKGLNSKIKVTDNESSATVIVVEANGKSNDSITNKVEEITSF